MCTYDVGNLVVGCSAPATIVCVLVSCSQSLTSVGEGMVTCNTVSCSSTLYS